MLQVIPYKNYKEKFKIVFQELTKKICGSLGQDLFIQLKNREVETWERNAERVYLTQKTKGCKS